MKAVISADVHAHPYANSPVTTDGSNQQLLSIVTCLDTMRITARDEKIKDIVIIGDLFHDRKGVPPEASHRVSEWLERCKGDKLTVHVIVGNHDLSIGGSGCTSARALAGLACIYEKSGVAELSDGSRVGFLPYTDDPLAVRASMLSFNKAKARAVFAHLGIGDPRLADCIPTDYEVPGHINVSDLRAADFDQVFLGHYHNAQKVAKNARYVGSPLQLSFKEAGQKKGFVVVDGPAVRVIVNNSSPRFHKMTYDDASKLVASGEISKADSIWVTGVDEDEVENLTKYAEETGSRIRIERSKAEACEVRIDASRPEFEILKQFVNATSGEEDPLEREELAKLGTELMSQAGK